LGDRMNEITPNPNGLAPGLREKLFLERQHVANSPEWYDGIIKPDECGDAVRQIADLAEFGAAFSELLSSKNLSAIVSVLFDRKEPILQSMIGRPKAARVGNGVRNGSFHRDTPTEAFESERTVIGLLCLD